MSNELLHRFDDRPLVELIERYSVEESSAERRANRDPGGIRLPDPFQEAVP